MSFYGSLFQQMQRPQGTVNTNATQQTSPPPAGPMGGPVVSANPTNPAATQPAAPTNYGEDASLRDIFDYMGSRDASGDIDRYRPWQSSGLNASGNADWGQQAHSSFDRNMGDYGNPMWGIRQGSRLDNLNQQYGGAFALNDTQPGSGGSSADRWRMNVDYSKLPTTKFGTVDKVIRVTPGMKLKYPDMVENHPQYGLITRSENMTTGREWVGPALLAALGGGAGALVGAAGGAAGAANFRTAMSGAQAIRGLGSGGNPMGILANLALGQLRLPFANFTRPIANMAISQLTQRPRSGG